MSDKYFSQLNGYKVKDADARASIETLSENVVHKKAQGAAEITTLADDHKNATDRDIVNRAYVKTKLANINTGGTTTGGGTQLYKHVLQTSEGRLTVITTKGTAYTLDNFEDLNKDTLIAYLGDCVLIQFEFYDLDEFEPYLLHVRWDLDSLEIVEDDIAVTGFGTYTPTKI